MSSTIVTVNPATGAELATYQAMTQAEIDSALNAAAAAQRGWAGEDFTVRAEILRTAAALLRERDDELALLITREMGKPLAEARAEVHKCADGLEFYAEHAQTFLADEVYETAADRSWVSYEPVGVVLAVMPWNFPLWQVFRFAAPALMAGNAALLKHSPNTTGAALACQGILWPPGCPTGCSPRCWSPNPRSGGHRAADRRPPGGGGHHHRRRARRQRGRRDRRAGDQEVGAGAGWVGPVRGAGRRRSAAGGPPGGAGAVPQCRAECISPKRFIVEAAVAEVRPPHHRGDPRLRVGEREKPGTDVGPMARRDLRDRVAAQVRAAVAAGATVLCGGEPREDLGGFFYSPTVLGGVTPAVSVYRRGGVRPGGGDHHRRRRR